MEVNVRALSGNWDQGYALDKHTLYSNPLGENSSGRMLFDTVRPPAGQALFQLKYRADFSQIEILADAVVKNIVPLLPAFSMVIPMPASKWRARQPVTELANAIAKKMGLKMFEMLHKASTGQSLKDLNTREEKDAALTGMMTLNPAITNMGTWNALLVDDLHDSGATLSEACRVLRTYAKIGAIYVATMTCK